jgi:hypothetical protein
MGKLLQIKKEFTEIYVWEGVTGLRIKSKAVASIINTDENHHSYECLTILRNGTLVYGSINKEYFGDASPI